MSYRCDIMIHTANEFTAQHHRYLLSGTTLGLKSLGGESAELADKRGSESKASNASALTRCVLPASAPFNAAQSAKTWDLRTRMEGRAIEVKGWQQ